jgi:uncharacterized protein YutE (UPF0331/DUF86 family)
MADRELILAKAAAVKKHLKRIEVKRGNSMETFARDLDRQDIVLFNLQMAIQNCVDIAAHIVGEEGLGIPGSTSELFYSLEENGYLQPEIAEKMVRAVGFRNLLVHEYGKIDIEQVYTLAHEHLGDLNDYLVSIFKKTGIVV